MQLILRLGFLCLLFLPQIGFSAPGSAVFGSFKDRSLALKESAQISRRFGIEARIEEAVVKGVAYHRVLGPVMDQFSVRELVGEARANGFSDAWILSSNQQPIRKNDNRQREIIASNQVVERPSAVSTIQSPEVSQRNVSDLMPAQNLGDVGRVINTANLSTGDSTVMRIARVENANVKIDGRVDESIWDEIPSFDRMRVMNPDTLEKTRYSTQTRIFSDSKGLYVSAVMVQPQKSLVERLTPRDLSVNADTFYTMIDSSGEGLYGYTFGLSLGGSKQDGKIAPERVMSFEWDGPWEGETAKTEDGWSAEMFFPWSVLSMPDVEGARKLGLLIGRRVAHLDELWGWPELPFSKPRFISGFSPVTVEGVDPKQQWEVYPYVSATSDEITNEADGRGGIDVAWRPSSNLQLTATVNPDFGSVESDDVVVNLSAYETFFPEKRLFFLEGNEVFSTTPRTVAEMSSGPRGSGGRQSPPTWTMEPTTLLNTRRIGGSAKQVVVPEGVTVSGVEQGKPSELIGAVKMVGQSGGLRYGVLSAFEKEAELVGTDDETGLEVPVRADGRDFGVARVLYENVGERGRKSIGYMGTLASNPLDDAVVHGVDAHLLSGDGKFSWDTQLLNSDVDDQMGYGVFSDFSFSPKQGRIHQLKLDALDEKLDVSDLGFLRRNDTYGFQYQFMSFKSKGLPERMRNQRIGVFVSGNQNEDGLLTRSFVGLFGSFLFNNNSELRTEVNFMPDFYDDRNSRGNGAYRNDGGHQVSLAYGTSTAKKFSTSIQLMNSSGFMYDTVYHADLGFTYRPVDRFALDFDLTFEKQTNWLVYMGDRNIGGFNAFNIMPSLSMDYFISAKQQLSLKLQWVGINADESEYWTVPDVPGRLIPRYKKIDDPKDDFTVSQMTVQLRYRWEIAPLSDLFIVYTRGANLPNQGDQDFDYLFRDALSEPIVDVLTMKLRYRFGS